MSTMSLPGNAAGSRRFVWQPDPLLVLAALALLGLGLVMVGSASVSIAEGLTGDSLHYLKRQAVYTMVGVGLGFALVQLPLRFWEKTGPIWILAGMVLLAVLFVPGLGRTVNGSTRWLMVGPLNLQVSEFVKLALAVYLAGYLVRHGEAVRTTVGGFLKPMGVVAVIGVLLLKEPDFGTAAVMTAMAMGMMFLGGVRLWLFGVLVLLALGLLSLLAVSSPYRMERLTSFLNPWADPFNSGFQLTQALIAFGRGEWFGVGLGASVQKLFYLPEAHTDFVFAVLAEELGLVGVVVVVGLYTLLVWRGFAIARQAVAAGRLFGAHLAHGISLWLGMQAFVNLGVNMGVLPTKGLTLPLMSYGGSSILSTCLALALLLRIDRETAAAGKGATTARRRRA